MASIDAHLDPNHEEIQQLQKQKKQIDKDIAKLKKQTKQMSLIEDWKALSALQKECQNMVKKHRGWNLTRLQKMTPFYSLQHPTKTGLKSDDESVEWVQDFLKNGGKLATLHHTAQKSWDSTLNRTFRRKTRAKPKSTDSDSSTTTSSSMSMRGKT